VKTLHVWLVNLIWFSVFVVIVIDGCSVHPPRVTFSHYEHQSPYIFSSIYYNKNTYEILKN